MKILLVIPYISYHTPAAANIWGKNIARAFSLAGHDTSLLYIGSRFGKEWRDEYGVRFCMISPLEAIAMNIPKLRSILMPGLFKRSVRKYGYGYDYILPLEGPYNIEWEIDKVKAVKSVGAKYIFSILEHPDRNAGFDKHLTYEEYMKLTVNLYDLIMPITTYIRDIYIQKGSMTPILLTPIVVNTTELENIGIKDKKPIRKLLYCGNIRRSEEMEILFKEFAIVKRKVRDIKLVIVGGGNSRGETRKLIHQYRQSIREIGMEDSVEFKGRVLYKVVKEHYKEADAFLLPRPFREYSKAGFPTKLGEYLAAGKPVIAYSTGDISLYLKDGVSAYLVDDDSEGEFAKKVIHAIGDTLAYSIAQKGALVAKEMFSIEATAQRIEKYFRDK